MPIAIQKARPALFVLLLAAGASGLTSGCAGPARRLAGAAGVIQTARQQAAGTGDPLAAKLALWLRAQEAPGAADTPSATEIDSFLRDNPDWPGQAVMREHLQRALAHEPDNQVVRTLCTTRPPDSGSALVRCAAALAPSPAASYRPADLPPALVQAIRDAWVAGIDDPADEAGFLQAFAMLCGPDEQWRRFDRQEWSGGLAAGRRQVTRVDATRRGLAVARIALRAGDDGADRQALALHGADARDPTLMFDLARWHRRHDQDPAALALWRGPLLTTKLRDTHAAAFWAERDALARDFLQQHRDQEALFLAEDQGETDPGAQIDRDFLTGWIELRRLHQPDRAEPHFAELPRNSHSAITASRGFYWVGQALDAEGRGAEARAAYAQAALRPTTFYGQAALRALMPRPQDATAALMTRIAALRDPAWTQDDAIRFAGLAFARAATMLVAWGDAPHARAFLLRLDSQGADDRDHALAASLASRLGLPDIAVAIARNAGRHGLVLAQTGWPAPYILPSQPPLPAGLALSLMRQESSFDPDTVSPAGAHGLMQLMPATAREIIGNPAETPLLADPDINMALGTRYLAALLSRFGGSTAYTAAAYNAGPNRVQQWLQQTGNPAGAGDAPPDTTMIDWIEMIPYAETRNYVQRVIESETVYRSGGAAAADQLAWNPGNSGMRPGGMQSGATRSGGMSPE